MKKLLVLMLSILLAGAVAIGIIVVASNNNKVSTATGSAPQVTEVPAPKATATAVPTAMPMPKTTVMPNIATAMPTNVPTAAPTTAVTTLTSLEASEKTILVDSLGYRHAMILEGDLKKVTYKEIEVDVENGIYMRLNGLGLIGEIWHRESMAQNVKTVNNSHNESYVRKFFSQSGELFTNYVREGYAELDTSTRLYQITGIRFVQLQGEDFFRLVVKGTGNSGNDYPVVTDKPAPTATVPPANTEEITTPPRHNETPAPTPTVTPKPTATVPPANTEEFTSRPPRHNTTPEPEYTAVPTPAGVTPPPVPSADDEWDDWDW